ncbi:MAG: tetratricopeptide repeat protein [Candidatus Latescibacterota bacterium]
MSGETMIKKTTVVSTLIVVTMAFFVSAFFSGCGKSPDTLYTEGKALIQKKETLAQGMRIFEKFEKKFPGDSRTPEVLLALATFNQDENKFKEAEAAYNRLLTNYPKTAEAYKGMFLLGYMYYEEMKDNERAKATLNKFIAAYPDSGLAVSARVLLENIGLPLEQWNTVKNILSDKNASTGETPSKTK